MVEDGKALPQHPMPKHHPSMVSYTVAVLSKLLKVVVLPRRTERRVEISPHNWCNPFKPALLEQTVQNSVRFFHFFIFVPCGWHVNGKCLTSHAVNIKTQ